ncbi:Smg-4/UPF3 family-domain-containing protein [Massariosphaeria phaeospora]|uniref:Smg-4/UPF3 family-domain-containing protein n=1 Tax=Massariosphaeria phaeospora TaxID=100035 RepID=A0A7C8I3G1_9PLEO|nr:Smg-4/UPF3 family-domain-containing protein [Massariosphaeria phaeospora]
MAPPPGVNGVIPVTVLQKNGPASVPRGPKAAQPRLKLVCRRLPPGLTKTEFEAILGEEWKLGAGKIDWMDYKGGKISKDASKPSRPSRAYVHVTSQSHVTTLGDRVREAIFQDAAKSFQDPALVGPPTLEFSPNPRMPGNRRRNDARQGTIDQDQEFKDFLESLTNPITKPPAAESDNHKEEKVKTTPLIEALRERKANKDKPQAKGAAKHGRGESKEDAAERADKKSVPKAGKENTSTPGDKSRRLTKIEKLAKEAVKVLNKEVSLSKDAPPSADKPSPARPSPLSERKRGDVSIAKSMLQRDLGIGPAASRRRGTKREVTSATQGTSKQPEEGSTIKQKAKDTPVASVAAVAPSEKPVPASTKKERPSRAERRAFKASLVDKTNGKPTVEDVKAPPKGIMPAPVILKKPQSAQTTTAPKGPAASRAPPTEPAAARNGASQAQVQATPPRPANPTPIQATSTPPAPAPAPTGRQAFLKHANASQGITESLIEEALKAFGAIEKVEIDKRKGFAYADFVDPEGLLKAIAASPVKVAQGAVQVLERKEKVARSRPVHGLPTGPARGGRGGFPLRGRGRGGARGGAHNVPSGGNVPVEAAPAPTPVATAPVPTVSDSAT